ncbi:hypothetical protein ABB02_00556 [Clostridiaceae bacterium JG1575]|nr:hypothetical protein ABB02_00556 [Clostridiaceae bacterium JG1575]
MLSKKLSENTWILRLNKGEELLEQVTAFCTKEAIRLGTFTGLGALEEVEMGLFLHDEKTYQSKTWTGAMEIIALHGNITTKDGALYLHCHMGIGDEALTMHGGHLNRAIINPTCELFLTSYEGMVDRFFDAETGLNLLAL